MKAFIFLLLIVGVVVGMKAPCTLPSQFQTRLFQVTVDETQCASSISVGEYYYDFINQATRIDLSGTGANSQNFVLTEWDLYNDGITYFFDRTSGVCVATKLTNGLDQITIPADSTFAGTFMIGLQAVDAWLFPGASEDDYEVLTVTEGTCEPVSSEVFNTSSSIRLIAQQAYNFLSEVPPYIFDVPSVCTGARSVESLPKAVEIFKKGNSKLLRRMATTKLVRGHGHK